MAAKRGIAAGRAGRLTVRHRPQPRFSLPFLFGSVQTPVAVVATLAFQVSACAPAITVGVIQSHLQETQP